MKKIFKYFIIGCKVLLSNGLIIVLLINFSLISNIVYKAINNKNKLEKYESLKTEIEEKMENKIVIENTTPNINEAKGVTKITNCLKSPILKEELSENLLNISNELENYMN